MSAAQDPVLFEQHGSVAVITLNRPDRRNAVDDALTACLRQSVDRLENDGSLSAGILRGAGPTFCAGMDLQAFLDGKAESILFGEGGFAGLVKRKRTKPIIAAVHGAALAGGFELMLACDLAICTTTCRFGLPEARLGLVAGGGGAVRLAQCLPRALANEILLLGDAFDAERALDLGLVNAVVDDATLMESARMMADTIAMNAPGSIAAGLAVVNAAAGSEEDHLWQVSDAALRQLLASDDAREGASAFAQKRKPSWRRPQH